MQEMQWNQRKLRKYIVILFVVGILSGASGCQAIQEIINLRNVAFDLDRVSDMRLAGVDVENLRNYNRLSIAEVSRLAQAVIDKEFPLEFVLHVGAENPADNSVNARLTQMDWKLFLQDKQTVSGNFSQTVVMPPGQRTDIPITIGLNLTDFFQGNARELINLVTNLVGAGGEPTQLKLTARPVIETPIGPIQYPSDIEIVSRTVGEGS